jgi:hypothetical protein
MLVWGGGDGQLVDDSAVFDVAQCKWTILPHSTPVRCAHTLDVVGEQLYCFGGGDGVKLFNDVLVPSFDPAVRRDTLAETFTALCASTAPAPVVAERPNVRRSLVMPHSPTLRARSPLAASALPAACGDAPHRNGRWRWVSASTMLR